MLRFFIEKMKLGCKKKTVEAEDITVAIAKEEESIIDMDSLDDEVDKKEEKGTEETTLESTKQSESFDRPGIFPWLNLPYVPRRRILDFVPTQHWHEFGQISYADSLMVASAARSGRHFIHFRVEETSQEYVLMFHKATIYLCDGRYGKYETGLMTASDIDYFSRRIKAWMKIMNNQKIGVLGVFKLNTDTFEILKAVAPQGINIFGAPTHDWEQMQAVSQEMILSLIEFKLVTRAVFPCIDESFVLTLIDGLIKGKFGKSPRSKLRVEPTLMENLDRVERSYNCHIKKSKYGDILSWEIYLPIASSSETILLLIDCKHIIVTAPGCENSKPEKNYFDSDSTTSSTSF